MKLGRHYSGVHILGRIIGYWSPYWGPTILGNYPVARVVLPKSLSGPTKVRGANDFSRESYAVLEPTTSGTSTLGCC